MDFTPFFSTCFPHLQWWQDLHNGTHGGRQGFGRVRPSRGWRQQPWQRRRGGRWRRRLLRQGTAVDALHGTALGPQRDIGGRHVLGHGVRVKYVYIIYNLQRN